jgi:hypothetical protein
MSLVGSILSNDTGGSGQLNVAILERINPATGAQTVALTLNLSGIAGDCCTVSYTGVNQTTASGTPVTDSINNTTITSSTCTVSSNTGDMVGDVIQLSSGISGNSGNQTSRYTGTANGAGYPNGAQDAAGAASVSMMYSWTIGTITVAHLSANILQAGGGTPKLFRTNPGGNLSGLGSGGPFFQNPLQRVADVWKRRNGIFVPLNYFNREALA